MSGIRLSHVWAIEDSYGGGLPEKSSWLAPPPGSYMSFNYSRSATDIYTPGSKTFDTVAYGAISGTWNWSFDLDYDYMGPLLLAFEDYSVKGSGSEGKAAPFTHTFSKSNVDRIPSFVVRRKQLNHMAGGPAYGDEVSEFVGCVCKDIKFNMQAGSSQITVSMSGSFMNVSSKYGRLDETDYLPYSGDLVEFSCMYMGTEDLPSGAVANVDSMSVNIDNSAGTIASTCTPVTVDYNEGKTDYGFSASCYSNDPDRFRRFIYSGGKDNTHSKPLFKGQGMLPRITLMSHNKDTFPVFPVTESSTRYIKFTINNCILKSIEWQKGDDSKIMDQLSSVKCQSISIEVMNGSANLEKEHTVTSGDPRSEDSASLEAAS